MHFDDRALKHLAYCGTYAEGGMGAVEKLADLLSRDLGGACVSVTVPVAALLCGRSIPWVRAWLDAEARPEQRRKAHAPRRVYEVELAGLCGWDIVGALGGDRDAIARIKGDWLRAIGHFVAREIKDYERRAGSEQRDEANEAARAAH